MRRDYDLLIPMAEVARLLGVSRQRVFQLAATEGFPRPLYDGSMGMYRKRVWSKRAISKWAKARKRAR